MASSIQDLLNLIKEEIEQDNYEYAEELIQSINVSALSGNLLGQYYGCLAEQSLMYYKNFEEAVRLSDLALEHISPDDTKEILHINSTKSLAEHFLKPTLSQMSRDGQKLTALEIIKSHIVSDIDIEDVLTSLYNIPEIRDIFKVEALNLLDNPHARIIVSYELLKSLNEEKTLITGVKSNIGATTITYLNSLLLPVEDPDFKATIAHEILHLVIGRAFSNTDNYPYFKNNIEQREEFAKAKKALGDNLVKLDSIDPNKILSHDEKYILDAIISSFAAYPIEEVDAEIPAYWIQLKVHNFSDKDLELVKPIYDYMYQYVMPEIRNFIEHHPYKNMIAEEGGFEVMLSDLEICALSGLNTTILSY
jgi:hypothetical protein